MNSKEKATETDESTLTREQYRHLKNQQAKKQAVNSEQPVKTAGFKKLWDKFTGTKTTATTTNSDRWQRTNKRLNWTIMILLGLIVIVYLVLFLVN